MVFQQWRETRLLEHHLQQIRLCTFRIHCLLPKRLLRRHTCCLFVMFKMLLNAKEEYLTLTVLQQTGEMSYSHNVFMLRYQSFPRIILRIIDRVIHIWSSLFVPYRPSFYRSWSVDSVSNRFFRRCMCSPHMASITSDANFSGCQENKRWIYTWKRIVE